MQILDGWNLVAQRFRQPTSYPVGGNSDRFGDISQGVLDDRFAPALAEQQPQSGRIRSGPQERIGGGEIEIQLARISGLERPNFALAFMQDS